MEFKTICFFNSTKNWGGGEKWHYEMALFLHEQGFKVLVIVSPNSELHKKLAKKKVPTETIKVSNLSYLNFKKIQKTASFLKKHKIDTIIINSSQDMKLGGLAAKRVGINRVIYRRGSAIPIKNTFINRYFFQNVLTEVLANSLATKKTINQNNKKLFPEESIKVIPNGIDISSFDALDYEKLYTPIKNEFVLGNLGRMVYQKNQEFLLDVATELKKRSLNFKILIGGSGKLKEEINEKIKKLNLDKEIHLLGMIKNPKSFMMSIDAFLLPSRWEGFGYVLAEAMLCEKPVVAFDVSSNSQIVEPKINGFLTPFNDVKLFSDKIELLINSSDLELNKIGKKGRLKIEREFNSVLIQEKVKNYLLA